MGVDPGSIKTGFGLINVISNKFEHIDNGLVAPPKNMIFRERVAYIFNGIRDVINEYRPDYIAIEDIFMSKNAQSALKLGHVRGAIMSAAIIQGVPIFEYRCNKGQTIGCRERKSPEISDSGNGQDSS